MGRRGCKNLDPEEEGLEEGLGPRSLSRHLRAGQGQRGGGRAKPVTCPRGIFSSSLREAVGSVSVVPLALFPHPR